MELDIVKVFVATTDHAVCFHFELIGAERVVDVPQLDILSVH